MRPTISRGPSGDCCLVCGRCGIDLTDGHRCEPNVPLSEVQRRAEYSFEDMFKPRTPTPRAAVVLGHTPAKGSPQARLTGLLRTVNAAARGQRNATLHWAACRAGEMIASGELPQPRPVADALGAVASSIGLTEGEIVATVRSGFATSGVKP